MDYIGIDVHKLHSQVCISTEAGIYEEQRIRTDRARFDAMLGDRPHARILVEASTESEWVAQHLEKLGHEVVVADPNYGPMYGNRSSRIKTDLRDARMLCDAGRLGVYRAAHRCSQEARQLRARLMVPDALVKTRSRYISVVCQRSHNEGPRVVA